MDTHKITCNCEGCELRSLFFSHVSDEEIGLMCERKVEKEFKKGEIIIREGDEISEFIYLRSGLVKLYRQGLCENEQIICFARPLDFVSLLSIFAEKRYNYSVAALEDSVTCNLELLEVKQMAEHNGRFALGILEKLNRASDKIIIDFLEVKQKRLFGRIAYILLFFANDIYKSNTFDLPISRKEIAEFIGMSVENVIRTLSDFRKDKIIRIFGKTIEIVDVPRLKKISDLS